MSYLRAKTLPEGGTQRTNRIVVMWVVTPCGDVEHVASIFRPLGDAGILPHHHTASQPRTPRLESSSPWKPQISYGGQMIGDTEYGSRPRSRLSWYLSWFSSRQILIQ